MIIGISGYIGSGKDLVAEIIMYLTMGSKDPNTWGETSDYGFKDFQERNHKSICGYWENKKFAGKLKQMVSLLTGIPVADLEKSEVKNSELGSEWRRAGWKQKGFINIGPTESITVRHLLQVLGTNAVRDVIHPNAWVNALFADYQPKLINVFSGGESRNAKYEDAHVDPIYPNWIISDTRFPNEAKAIKDRGGLVIRVIRLSEERRCTCGTSEKDHFQFQDGKMYSTYRHPYTEATQMHSSETGLNDWNSDWIIDNNGTIEDLIEQVRKMLLHFKIIS